METYQTRSVPVPAQYGSHEKKIRSRERHLDVVVVAWVLVGVFYVVYGLAVAALMVLFAGTDQGLDAQLRIVLPILAIASLLACLVIAGWFLITAWGLHRRKRSGRVSSYVLSVLLLLTGCFLPLGIYTLWVLIGKVTDMAFGRFPDLPDEPRTPQPQPAPSTTAQPPKRERNLTPLPPSAKPRRAGLESYPRPPVATTTPPTGVPKHMPQPAAPNQRREQDINSLPTVQDLPAPMYQKKK